MHKTIKSFTNSSQEPDNIIIILSFNSNHQREKKSLWVGKGGHHFSTFLGHVVQEEAMNHGMNNQFMQKEYMQVMKIEVTGLVSPGSIIEPPPLLQGFMRLVARTMKLLCIS